MPQLQQRIHNIPKLHHTARIDMHLHQFEIPNKPCKMNAENECNSAW